MRSRSEQGLIEQAVAKDVAAALEEDARRPSIASLQTLKIWAAYSKHVVEERVRMDLVSGRERRKEQLEASIAANTSTVYRMLKDQTLVGVEEVVTERGETSSRTWAKWWKAVEEKPGTSMFDYHEYKGLDLPNTIGVDQFRKAAGSFKVVTSCSDGWHPRHFGHLSDAATRCLGMLWTLFEWTGKWPESEAVGVVVLIPKPSGGRRPIMLFRSMYRVYARIRSFKVRAWFQETSWAAIGNAAGRSRGDSVWWAQVRDLVGAGKQVVVEISTDLK